MRAYIPEDIIRNGNTWVGEGSYKVLRRFDDSRWIIVLKEGLIDKDYRLITLVPVGYLEFSRE